MRDAGMHRQGCTIQSTRASYQDSALWIRSHIWSDNFFLTYCAQRVFIAVNSKRYSADACWQHAKWFEMFFVSNKRRRQMDWSRCGRKMPLCGQWESYCGRILGGLGICVCTYHVVRNKQKEQTSCWYGIHDLLLCVCVRCIMRHVSHKYTPLHNWSSSVQFFTCPCLPDFLNFRSALIQLHLPTIIN